MLSAKFLKFARDVIGQILICIHVRQGQLIMYARSRNLSYSNVGRDENPQGVNEMDSPSFRGFHA